MEHFYNPLNGAGLSFPGLGLNFTPALEWALEDSGSISSQVFSYTDARSFFYQGLTQAQPHDRELNLALTFYTLGHVIHLVQDLAQPQHTRNDPHLGSLLVGLGPIAGALGLPHTKFGFYEQYTEAAALNDPALPPHPPFSYDGYDPVYSDVDPVTFNNARNFWTTSGGLGLADYSNRGFVSVGTNLTAVPTCLGCFSYDILPNINFSSPNAGGA